MNYDIILYINGSVICTLKKDYNEYFIAKSILENGIIQNKRKFELELIKVFKSNKVSTAFFTSKILIIYNGNISINDYNVLKNIFEKFNFKLIRFIKDSILYKIKRNEIYLFISKDNIRLAYKNEYNQIIRKFYDLNNISTIELKYILKRNVKNKIVNIIGDNPDIIELLTLLTNDYYQISTKNFLKNILINKVPKL